MAIGSVNETVAIFDLALERGFISQENCDIMITQAESIVKQLSAFRQALKSR